MRWPSKDPDDYMRQGSWDANPPRWLAWLLGKTDPDPIPMALWLPIGILGLALGSAVGALAGLDQTHTTPAGCWIAELTLSAVWYATRKRRGREAPST